MPFQNKTSPPPASIAGLRARVSRSLRALDDAPREPGWNGADMSSMIGPGPRRPAAVLIAMIDRGEDLTVLFTRRTEHLSHHAGQISFPGGGVEPCDTDAVTTALRETHEEIGIDPALVEPVGYIDLFETNSNYAVTPVVGWLDAGYRAAPDPREVAEVFEVPLAFLLDPANRRPSILRPAPGHVRESVEFDYAGKRIWGATALMLLNLLRRMENAT